MAALRGRYLRVGIDVVFRPGQLVAAKTEQYTGSYVARVRRATYLSTVYLASLVLYAIPLTYAGVGTGERPEAAPEAIGGVAAAVGTDPITAWQYTSSLIENCAFLFVGSALTLIAFHLGAFLTRNSKGVLQSLHTIVYSTGIYLAAIFSFAWYLSISPEIAVADQWLIGVQVEFINRVLEFLDTPLRFPGDGLAGVETSGMTTRGQLGLAGLFIAVLYYFYSLYLGARVNHEMGRTNSLLAVLFVAVTPVLYIVGAVLAQELLGDATVFMMVLP